TVLVPVGAAKVIEFLANNPGDWIFHCHMTHHTMNQMGHEFPNMVGMEIGGFDEKVRTLIPGYMTMGTTGMCDMTKTGMPIPKNSIPMLGYDGPFEQTILGGMANILRVREKTDDYKDPGPYAFPRGSISAPATQGDLLRDKIIVIH
ncbi:MAG: multicopper oxidase domain-containing protein, partial [Simkaniaceae bacterium]|nr:multicopper oxidase domain-containing protein [Simkaniaceae bacterium]